MICVGIDVSKRKSTVCFMAPGDKIIRRPFDVKHTKEELQPLVDEIGMIQQERQNNIINILGGHSYAM